VSSTSVNQSASKILFIHGFASCGKGNKAEILRKHFGSDRLISPDLPVEPAAAIRLLKQIIAKQQPVATISSSLGSFYATSLNQHQIIPAIVINPAVNAHKTLAPHIGLHKHWCSGETFALTRRHIKQLEAINRGAAAEKDTYLVLLKQQDEVLDYRQAAEFYQGNQVIIEAGGNHRFENLDKYLTIIDQFISRATR